MTRDVCIQSVMCIFFCVQSDGKWALKWASNSFCVSRWFRASQPWHFIRCLSHSPPNCPSRLPRSELCPQTGNHPGFVLVSCGHQLIQNDSGLYVCFVCSLKKQNLPHPPPQSISAVRPRLQSHDLPILSSPISPTYQCCNIDRDWKLKAPSCSPPHPHPPNP